MKVRLLTKVPDYGPRGAVCKIDQEAGSRLICMGVAEAVEFDAAPVETPLPPIELKAAPPVVLPEPEPLTPAPPPPPPPPEPALVAAPPPPVEGAAAPSPTVEAKPAPKAAGRRRSSETPN